jgi:hypothetical protein
VRCYERPAHAGASWIAGRILAGTLFVPSDHFDRNGETWLRMSSHLGGTCWVPESQSERGAGAAPSSQQPREFDLPAVALETPTAGKLIAAGAFVTFEPEDDVIGLSALIDGNDPRLLPWLEELRQLGPPFSDGPAPSREPALGGLPDSREDSDAPQDATPAGEAGMPVASEEAP